MTKINPFALILVLVTISLLGFCVENIFISFSVGYMDNRNMVLPFLWGYGLAVFGIILLFGTPSSPLFFGKAMKLPSNVLKTLYYFSVAFICVCVGEIILGYVIQYTCDIIWWDYTRIPLHLTRYTSIPTSFGFAAMITFFVKYCFYPLLSFYSKMHPQALRVIAISFAVMLSVDMLNSLLFMISNHDILKIWRISLKKATKKLLIKNLYK